MKKRILAGILSTGMLLTAASYSFVRANEAEITVKLDGNTIDFDVKPEIIDGRTMVPLRKIFEEIGAFVKWDNDTQTVSARKSSKTVTLQINSSNLQIDKGDVDSEGNAITDTVELDVPPQLVSNRTLVPTRAVSEAFGLDVDWDEESNTVSITSKSDDDDSWKSNTGEIKLDSLSYTGSGIEISGNQILITQGGDFTLTGALSEGSITVNTEDKVKLRLNGVNITSNQEPCIYIENAGKAYITVSDGTENNLNAKNSEKGAVYSKDNLEIKGKGTLNIESAAGHGIKASDNLTIENGNINITAEKDAVNVNDTFKMTGGTLKTTSVGDGIASASIVEITGGTLDITTTAEPTEEINSDKEQSAERQFRGFEAENKSADFAESSKGIKADWMMRISGGDITVSSADHAIHCADELEITGGALNISSEYGKGISAHGNFTIDGSDTVINILKSVEGLESKNILTINDGTISIISSDDGINATGGNSGEMFGPPNMGGGRNDMNNRGDRPDDKFNGENPPQPNENMTPPEFDNENMQGQRPPERASEGEKFDFGQGDFNPFNESPEQPKHNEDKSRYKDCLVINGGYIEVYAENDCLDSNGNLILNGGIIKATKTDGSFKGNFGIFDPDGALEISEGVTIVAACLKGEEQTMDIPQNNIILYCDERHSAGDAIVLKDKSGNVIAEYSPKGDYQAVLITSPELKNGDCSISAGNENHDITVTEANTVLGERTNTGFGNGGFGNGGFRNDRKHEPNRE